LIAAGPDLKRGATIDVPSANVDFAPTFLKLLNIAPPPSIQGRPLEEALVDTAIPGADATRTTEHTVTTPDGTYAVTATFSSMRAGDREFRYFDGAKAVRK
jgi:arylsulfatase A-like enzyme